MAEPIAEVGWLAGLCGRIGTAWQKQGMIWSYCDVVTDSVFDLNLSAPEDVLVGTPVPAGEVWVLSVISGFVNSATCTIMYIGIVVDGVEIFLRTLKPPDTGLWYPVLGQYVLKEGDYVKLWLYGLTALDDAYLKAAGYKMRLDL